MTRRLICEKRREDHTEICPLYEDGNIKITGRPTIKMNAGASQFSNTHESSFLYSCSPRTLCF